MADLCMGEDFSEELTCAVCLDSWKHPTEAVPCGHIFCEGCMKGIKKCPVCRVDITSTKTPNRTLVNMSLQIPVKCAKCGWKGTREQSYSHKCGTAPPAPAAPSAAGPNAAWPPQSTGYNNNNPNSNAAPAWGNGTSWGGTNGVGGFNSGAPGSYYLPQQPQHMMPQSSSGYSARPPQQPQQMMPAANTGYSSRPPGRRYDVIQPTGSRPWVNYGIGQDEYDQIVSLFVFFDDDDSGALDRNEVGRLARWLNFARTPQEVDRIFQDMDYDGDGSLALPEFLTWLKYNKPDPQALYGLTQAQYNTVMMQFHTYDSNQDGCLEMNEFTRLVLGLGDVRDEASAHRLFRMIDKDQSGSVDLHEFLSFRAGRV